MQIVALAAVALSGLWLIVIAGLMWARPQNCLSWLSKFASTWQINVTEMSLRGAVGLSFLVRSPSSKAPELFEIGGWFIFVTSIMLLIVPRRWHAAYAVWWSKKLPTSFVRAMAPLTAAAGLTLIYVAL